MKPIGEGRKFALSVLHADSLFTESPMKGGQDWLGELSQYCRKKIILPDWRRKSSHKTAWSRSREAKALEMVKKSNAQD